MATQPRIPMVMEPRLDPQETGLPEELKNKLKSPLPGEAIKAHPRISGLSSINAAFIIERMNEVFGPGGYQEKYREIQIGSREEIAHRGTERERPRKLHVATVHGTLTIPKYNIHLESYGGSDNEDLGDALKGACTDAFTKACSHLGIGLDVYKGGREAAAGHSDDRPACPGCGKTLFRNRVEDGPGYYCWKTKGGCGANFSEEGLKAAQASKNGKPAQSAGQPNGKPQPVAAAQVDASRFTIQATVKDRRRDDHGTFWLQVGDYTCATKNPDIMNKLTPRAYKGAEVELLVSGLSGKNNTTIYQIHKVISVKPPQEGGR